MGKRSIRTVHPEDPVKVMFGACDEYRFLATGDDTDGSYFLVEAVVPPGGGPPLHVQTQEEEAFYILEGVLTFYGDEGETIAGPGTYLNIPKGAKHRFRNNSGEVARMLFFFAPAGIEDLFVQLGEMDEPVGDMGSIVASLNALGAEFGVEYFAP